MNDILDLEQIRENLDVLLVGSKALVYKSTSSTNDIAWEYARNKQNTGLAVFAEEQTRGRGRRGNKWLSTAGSSLLCSILVMDFVCPPELMAVTSAVAAAEAVNKTASVNSRIKWPNDIMLNSKKLAGILLESRPAEKGNDYVVGIGVNCHQKPDFFDNTELLMPATSLDIETGGSISRNTLAGSLLKSFDNWLNIARSDSGNVVTRWMQLSSQLGTRISVIYDNQTFSGNCVGVDPAEGLILQLDNGGVRMFEAARTTILK